jgi:putative zinc finger/helix-turn-helix YgiT family protein
MNCPHCKKPNFDGKPERYHYKESGLQNVFLDNVLVRRCAHCGEHEVVIPRLPELHRTIAEILIEKRAPLAGAEFRYLRKHLGYASSDFATKIGVTPETLSRWENEHREIDPVADKLIRLLVATSKPVERYPEEILASADWKKSSRRQKISLSPPKRAAGAWHYATA